jgi:uncharacterized protein (DUF2249 family)
LARLIPAAPKPPILQSPLEENTTMTANVTNTVDVRTIIPRERHPLIFNTFHNLAPGDAFLLVNDHDPKPLYYQFQAELSERFQWAYLESGPEVWKVRIGKAA